MNNNRLFDEHIKEQFSDYAPDVPAHIWENIVAEKRRKRPAGLWFTLLSGRNIAILIAVLLAGGAGSWWLFRGPAPATEKNIAQQQTQPTTQNATSRNNSTVEPSSNEKINSGSINSTNNTTTTTNTSNQPISTDRNNTPANSNYSNSGSTKTTTASPLPFKVNGGKADNNEAVKQNKNKRATSIPGKDNIVTTNPGLETDNPSQQSQGTLMGRLLASIDAFSVNKKEQGEPKLRLTPFSFLPGCPSLEKDAAANKTYFSIYGGPDFVFRSLTDTGNSAYLQKRKESSRVSSAYSAGIAYSKVFGNSMSLRAGLNYSQINEKFTFVQGNLVQVTYIIDSHGDTTGSYTTTGTRYKTTHNKYRSVDVPLLIGYEMGNGRLHANVNAGVVLNVYSWQKGEVLDTTYQPVTITTGKGSSPYQFKTNAGLGVTGGVSVFYKLNDNVHLMAEPYFRYNLKQMNKEALTLKQKYNTVGLRVGLRVDLH